MKLYSTLVAKYLTGFGAKGVEMTKAIQALLEESRERRRTTTKGEWHWKATGPSTARIWADSGPVTEEKVYIGDAEFITGAHTWEPRFREALAVAVEELTECSRLKMGIAAPTIARNALARIETILRGER